MKRLIINNEVFKMTKKYRTDPITGRKIPEGYYEEPITGKLIREGYYEHPITGELIKNNGYEEEKKGLRDEKLEPLTQKERKPVVGDIP